MSDREPVLWGIHAGATGDADSLFFRDNCIAIGWPKMGDLATLKADREAFKAKLLETHPQYKAGAIPGVAGQLFRFANEIKIGDLVVYRSKHDRQIHLGKIDGPYRSIPSKSPEYPNQRPVKWLRAVPITHFSQGALYEIGSAMSFFQVKTYAEEFRAAAEGQAQPQPIAKDDTVAQVAEGIEETTSDYVLKKLAEELKGHPLAEFIAHLLGAMGYRTRLSPPGADGGVDIIAHKDELGFEPPVIKVQVKSSDGNVGDPVVSALYGKVSSGEFGLLITLGSFTNQAMAFARNKSNLRLIAGEELVSLVLQHYERFDARYKGLIPLKRVYVPEPLEDGEK